MNCRLSQSVGGSTSSLLPERHFVVRSCLDPVHPDRLPHSTARPCPFSDGSSTSLNFAGSITKKRHGNHLSRPPHCGKWPDSKAELREDRQDRIAREQSVSAFPEMNKLESVVAAVVQRRTAMTVPNYRRLLTPEFGPEVSLGKSTGISGKSRISLSFPHVVTFATKEPRLNREKKDMIANGRRCRAS